MRFITLISSSIALSFFVSSSAFAASTAPERTACSSQTGRDKARCESRHARLIQQGSSNRIVRARSTQNSSTFGRTLLRAAERKRRNEINAKSALDRGPTVRALPTTSDVNTSRIQYLKEYRENQLLCMEETHGRPRRLCFERIRNEVNQAMRDARGTWLKNRAQ